MVPLLPNVTDCYYLEKSLFPKFMTHFSQAAKFLRKTLRTIYDSSFLINKIMCLLQARIKVCIGYLIPSPQKRTMTKTPQHK